MLHHHKEIFSKESYSETLSSSSLCTTPAQENEGQCSTQTSCSTPMSLEDILNLLQQNAPPGFKYCLTLVLKEMDSLEKELKNLMLTKNTNKNIHRLLHQIGDRF